MESVTYEFIQQSYHILYVDEDLAELHEHARSTLSNLCLYGDFGVRECQHNFLRDFEALKVVKVPSAKYLQLCNKLERHAGGMQSLTDIFPASIETFTLAETLSGNEIEEVLASFSMGYNAARYSVKHHAAWLPNLKDIILRYNGLGTGYGQRITKSWVEECRQWGVTLELKP